MYFTWIGDTLNDCQPTEVNSIKGDCRYITTSQNGSSVETTSSLTASLGITFSELKCGIGYLTSCEVNSNVKTGKLLNLNYHQCIVIKNHQYTDLNGEYKLTSFFRNNRPTYKNLNQSKIYYEDTDFVLKSHDGKITEKINVNLESIIDFKEVTEELKHEKTIEYFEIKCDRNNEVIEEFNYTIFFKDKNSKLKHQLGIWGDPCPPYQILIYDNDYCVIDMVCCRKLKNYENDYLYYSYDDNNFRGKITKKSSDYQVLLEKID